jgi:trans-aconitate methyltransferase
MKRPDFNAEYYRRYYENRSTAVVTPAERRAEVRFVLAFCRHIDVDVRRFADVGAGTGWWAKELTRQYPACAEIETYDASAAAARIYGHRQLSIEKLGGQPADLVVCRDVLRYVPDAVARAGIGGLARKCRGVLYVQVMTREDDIDEEASDMSGYFRPVRWYLRELERVGFRNAGMGLFVSERFRKFDPFALELPAPRHRAR